MNINEVMTEIVKTLEGLKKQKIILDKEIEEGEIKKGELESNLNALQEELEQITDAIEQKKSVLQVYDKILMDTDDAYSKIVKSAESLYQMVKNTEKNA